MPFVKIDCKILDSTLWYDQPAREIFLTALFMAHPFEATSPVPELETRSTELTGWEVPPGWYGFVPAASIGIIRRAGVTEDAGLDAIWRLSQPDPGSRSPEYEGRRMVRVDGGFIVLNYTKYRDRDYTAAERSRRWRERQKAKKKGK